MAPGVAAWAAERLFVTVIRHRPPKREAGWAAEAERISIASPHGDLAAWVWDGGPRTVLLVHGWAGRGLQMGAFVRSLRDEGFRVVAHDGPSHGRSPGRTANLFKLTDGLVAAADAVGPLAGVIAHSLGSTAVLLASSRGRLDPGRFVAIAPMADTRTMSRGFAAMTGFSEPVVWRMRRQFERRLGFCWDEIEPMTLARGFANESLVIHDVDDRELPVREAESLARVIPSATSFKTAGLGHRRILRDREVVSRAVGFVTSDREIRECTQADHPAAPAA